MSAFSFNCLSYKIVSNFTILPPFQSASSKVASLIGLGSCLKADSALDAALLLSYNHAATKLQGSRERVYFAPFPELCCWVRLRISVVFPQ